MSERGVFAVDRGIWDHPVFADEPLTEREAWAWLIGEASFKHRTRNIAGRAFDLQPGQLVASIRFMADKWKWSKSKVERFIDRLRQGKSSRGGRPKKNLEKPHVKSEAMIETATETGMLVITVCNYAKYQRVSLPTETEVETQTGTAAGQPRDKREDTEDTEPFSLSPDNSARRRDDWPSTFEEAFWNAYPHKVGKGAALKALMAVRKRRLVTWAALMAGLQRYAAKTDDRAWCNPATWLNQQRWTDQPGAAQMPRAGPQRARGFADLLANLPPTDQTDEPNRQDQPYDLDLTANSS